MLLPHMLFNIAWELRESERYVLTIADDLKVCFKVLNYFLFKTSETTKSTISQGLLKNTWL